LPLIDAVEVRLSEEIVLAVVPLSDAFARLWPDLARDVGVGLEVVGNGTLRSTMAAAVLVAAGGMEAEALAWLEREGHSGLPRYVVGADTGRRVAARAVAAGAADYFALPDDLELLRDAVARAVTHCRAAREREAVGLGVVPDAFGEIVGASPALRAALARAGRMLRHADATVLITGETGTGKELLARALHAGGPRRAGPFVEVNCTALPAHLLESELFGHERGAFTDAHASKPGLFEVADGGTLFLDEIGQLAVELQAKLLRVLEDRNVRRVGGTASRQVDVRIVAATNDDLPRAVKAGAFREDLFFRLSVLTLVLPPLRERGDDAMRIAEALLNRLAERHGLPVPRVEAPTRRAILGYHWPGNVRELRNAIERALLLSPPGELRVDELGIGDTDVVPGPPTGALPFPAPLDEITRAAAGATLELCGGNRSEAARRLGISRARLARLLDH
jgi:two-component system response regulator HydG